MDQFRVVIIGGDLRQHYLAKSLEKSGVDVRKYGVKEPGVGQEEEHDNVASLIYDSNAVILPVPVSNDKKSIKVEVGGTILLSEVLGAIHDGQVVFGGMFSETMACEIVKRRGLCYDFMKMDEIAIRNAIATAEGAIAEAIQLSPENLHQKRCLVIGFGKCARVLADKLKGLSANVSVMARREVVRAQACSMGFHVLSNLSDHNLEKYQFIFNTVPAPVLGQSELEHVQKECIIIDLASKPGGTDFAYCRKHGLCAKLCGSLPGIYAPKASGEILADAVKNICALF